MTTEVLDTIRGIFHEAHVVDLDFSKWDRCVRLVVVARALPPKADRFALINVDLWRVRRLSYENRHQVETGFPDRYCQWTVMEYRCLPLGADGYRLTLTGTSPAPTLEVECGEIRVLEASSEDIDVVNPAWNRPYGPLARPSLDELAQALREKEHE